MLNIDISELSEANGDFPDGISLKEIKSVLENPRRRVSPLEGFPLKDFYIISSGYSIKQRILLIVSRIADVSIQVLQVKIANEEEIDFYYCKR